MRDITDIQRILNDYDAYLSVEKGMAENTREAYRRDIDKLHAWLTAGGLSLRDVTIDILREFLGDLHDVGIA